MSEYPTPMSGKLLQANVTSKSTDQDFNISLVSQVPNTEKVIIITFLSLLIFIMIIGNLLVIVAVATTQRLRTVTNFFVVSLAVTDLLMGLLVTPLAVVKQATSTWLFGRLLCEFWISMDVFLCTASILNLCCISLDRYFAITSPLAYAVKRSEKLAIIMVALVWLLSAAITCPPSLGWHEVNRHNSTNCQYTSDKGYVVFSALGSFYIPAIVIIFVYWRIFAVARKRQAVLLRSDGDASIPQAHDSESSNSDYVIPRAMTINCEDGKEVFVLNNISDHSKVECKDSLHSEKGSHKSNGSKSYKNGWNRSTKSSNGTTSTYRIHSCQQAKRDGYERAAFQRERRVAKSLAVVVGGFLLCWSPFFTVYIIAPFCPSCYFHPVLLGCTLWLGWLNSAINPFIYALNHRDFKKAFIRLTINRLRRPWKVPQRHNPNYFN